MKPAYAESRNNSYSFNFRRLQYTPKAELNLTLGMILATGTAFLSTPLALSIVALSCANYLMREKPQQDQLVEEYFGMVAPTGYRNRSDILNYGDPELQRIFKGLTHSFFRVGPNEFQGSLIIDNASATRMFTKK